MSNPLAKKVRANIKKFGRVEDADYEPRELKRLDGFLKELRKVISKEPALRKRWSELNFAEIDPSDVEEVILKTFLEVYDDEEFN